MRSLNGQRRRLTTHGTTHRAATVAACVLAAWASAFPGCAKTRPDAIRRATNAVNQHQPAEAASSATSVLNDSHSTSDRASAYYLRALARLQQGDSRGARSDLQAALNERPDDHLVARINAQWGNIEFDEGNYASAASRYASAVDLLPPRAPRDRMLFQYAAALQRCGRFHDGEEVYRRLMREHGNSPFAAQAARKLDWRMTCFAVQCGAFGDEPTAQRCAANLRAKGFDARVARAPSSAPLPFVVQCGRFARYADAQRNLNAIRPVQSDAFIVP